MKHARTCLQHFRSACDVLCRKTISPEILVFGALSWVAGSGKWTTEGIFLERAAEKGVKVFFPSASLCADNAAMVALTGHFYAVRIFLIETVTGFSRMKRSDVPLKKSLSQHLLRDKNLLNKLVRLTEITPDDTVVEIGAGKGDLTRALVPRARFVYAIELIISSDPFSKVSRGFANLRIIFSNALDVSSLHWPRTG
jgi:hypothetical protein